MDENLTGDGRKQPPHFLTTFFNQPVVIQEKGRVIIKGIAGAFENGFLVIHQPKIIGKAVKTDPPYVYVAVGQIGHIHPLVETEKVNKETVNV